MAGLVTDPGFDLVLFPSSDVCTVTQYTAYTDYGYQDVHIMV